MDKSQYRQATAILNEIEQLDQLGKAFDKSTADNNYMCKINVNGHQMKITLCMRNNLREVISNKIDSLNKEFKEL